MNASARMINSGRRLHLQHGPIDLIIEAWGQPDQIAQAYQQAATRFESVLTELVSELPLLRTRTNSTHCEFSGEIASRMWRSASAVGRGFFTTPMIAVAGSVADEILQAMTSGVELQKACVNNGGDIAIRLAPGQSTTVGVVSDLHSSVAHHQLPATLLIDHADGVGGLATSGWRGRSLSSGIADAVTVLARDATTADAAATLIANAVDVPDSRSILKTPASEIDPDSDLGDRLITTEVLPLAYTEICCALDSGRSLAKQLIREGLIVSAGLALAGEYQTTVAQTTIQHRKMPNRKSDKRYA